ncbi:hypothetical protein F5H01DRAFT_358879 [Linnemannia elongata]|nr:hypothetical protein F5H01DRAFT_358879 [Linnemannia elongata]
MPLQEQQEEPQLVQRRTTNGYSSPSIISSTPHPFSPSSSFASFSSSTTSTTVTTTTTTTSSTTTTPPISSEETIWYLAYGSNMCPTILTDSRKITPLETKQVCVPDYWLSFDLGGIPFSEPCFASILKKEPERMREREYAEEVHAHCRFGQAFVWDDEAEGGEGGDGAYPMELHGVVYRITLRDWELIVHSEGGWGYDVPIGYDMIHVPCIVYNTNEKVSARVLLARPKSIKPHCQPSQRYKTLLTNGARHNNLHPHYQESLARIVPYTCQTPSALRSKRMFRVFNLPLEWIFGKIIRLNQGREGKEDQIRPPFWMAWVFDKACRFSGWTHDWVFVPVVGVSGRCLDEGEMEVMRKQIEKALDEEKEKKEMDGTNVVEE